MNRLVFICALAVFLLRPAKAQTLRERIQTRVTAQALPIGPQPAKPHLVNQFYAARNYQPAFFIPGGHSLRQQLIQLIDRSGVLCLQASDYQPHSVRRMPAIPEQASIDSATEDILLVDAALHFLSDVYGGRDLPAFGYTGLKLEPDYRPVLEALEKCIGAGNLTGAVALLEPKQKEYLQAKSLFLHVYTQLTDTAFKEIRITNKLPIQNNKPLTIRLQQLGLLQVADSMEINEVIRGIKAAQQLFNVPADGKLNTATLEALNRPLHSRLDELATAVNYIRRLHEWKTKHAIILINLPSADLLFYEQGQLKLSSHIVAGKPATPTPTLSSSIYEVILYPYWHVPHSIATKELLPKIKRNKAYLENNNFQVLNRQGQIVNPATIPWHTLGPGNFPYTIRQSSGCDNSLGIIKFNFYNPFSVYLHDTPSKALFLSRNRFYSHGCMRVEKPIELAKILLKKDNKAIEALTAQCLKDQKPTIIKMETTMPVVVLYSTAWYDGEGNIKFYNDIYKKLGKHTAPQTALHQ